MGIYAIIKKYLGEKLKHFIPDNDVFAELDICDGRKLYLGFLGVEKSMQQRLGQEAVECYYADVFFALHSGKKITHAEVLDIGPCLVFPVDGQYRSYACVIANMLGEKGISVDYSALNKEFSVLELSVLDLKL